MSTSENHAIAANILIVDDRPDNIMALEAVLQDVPEYKLFSASSGREAIDLVKENDFALILMDLQMPIMDGYDTSKEIKKLERGKDVPIIMVTAIYTEDPHIVKGYQVGAIDYIGKPFNIDVLRAKVGIYANLYLKSRQIISQNKFLMEAEKAFNAEKDTRVIIETMPVGVLVADQNGTITQMNKEATNLWGGAKLVDLSHYNEYVGWWAESGKALAPEDWALARAINSGETSQYEIIEIQCFDGSRKTILNSASAIRDQNNKIIGAVDVMQDITSQKQVEDKLNLR